MKNLRKLMIVAFCLRLFTNVLFAQNIPNAGFETWTSQGFPAYENPANWGTLNSSTAIISVFTTLKATGADANSGNSAIKLISKFISFANATAPGMATTGTINTNTQAVEGGFVYTQRPYALIGWYKANPQTGDKGSVEVKLWRRVGGVEEVVGEAVLDISTPTSTYTRFVLPIDYTSANAPDSARLILFSSDGANAVAESELIIDDLAFTFCPTASVANTDETGVGNNDGTAEVTVTGGTSPYTYAWNNSQTTALLSGLSSGNYCVTVTDDDGCSVEACGIVSSPSCAGFSVAVTATDETIMGDNDGTATALVTGGTSPLSYNWGSATTTSIDNLSPGDYCVTVTDDANCVVTNCATVAVGEQPVGINNITFANTIVYPNPVVNELIVSLKGIANEAILYLFDISGKLQLSVALSNGNNTIATTNLSNGVYFYQIRNEADGTAINGRLVKQ